MLSIISRCPGKEPALLPREGTNTGLEKEVDIEPKYWRVLFILAIYTGSRYFVPYFACGRFLCVHKLSVLVRDRVDLPPCWLRKSERGGGGGLLLTPPPHSSFIDLSASLLLPRTLFRLFPSLSGILIQNGVRLIKLRSLVKVPFNLHFQVPTLCGDFEIL